MTKQRKGWRRVSPGDSENLSLIFCRLQPSVRNPVLLPTEGLQPGHSRVYDRTTTLPGCARRSVQEPQSSTQNVRYNRKYLTPGTEASGPDRVHTDRSCRGAFQENEAPSTESPGVPFHMTNSKLKAGHARKEFASSRSKSGKMQTAQSV